MSNIVIQVTILALVCFFIGVLFQIFYLSYIHPNSHNVSHARKGLRSDFEINNGNTVDNHNDVKEIDDLYSKIEKNEIKRLYDIELLYKKTFNELLTLKSIDNNNNKIDNQYNKFALVKETSLPNIVTAWRSAKVDWYLSIYISIYIFFY
jgi:hypothetical protein